MVNLITKPIKTEKPATIVAGFSVFCFYLEFYTHA